MIIPFATQSYRSDSLPLSAQRCLNMYAEFQPQGAKTQVAVFGAPGISSFATCGTGPVRGMHVLAGVPYVVSGNFLYSISSSGAITQLGGQISDSNLVSMDDNGVQIAIINGTYGYLYSTSGGFVRITDTGFTAANTTTALDGFFLFDRIGTNQIFRSAILDGADYSENAFASKEAKSDFVQAVRNLKEILHVFGAASGGSTELWANSGQANFPFQRLPGGTIDRGIIAPFAVAEADEALFIVASDRMAYRLSGASLQRISTHAIEQAWQKYTATSDCFATSYTWNGHKHVVFTFPSQPRVDGLTASWAWDVATNLWHERESRDINGQALGRWCGNCAVEAYGKTLIGDAFSGQVGYLDDSVQTEFGRPMYAEAVAPVLHADQRRAFMRNYELDIETGVGLVTGQGSDPQVMLDISDDGGRTWSYPQMWRSAGALGNYGKRLRWFRLGNFYQRVMRITMSDPVPKRILRSVADISVGMG